MHLANFCEYYIKASLSLIFLSNSTLVLLFAIPYNEQQKRALHLDEVVLGQGEAVQIISFSMIVMFVICLFLCAARVVPSCRCGELKVVAFVTIAALSMLGMCCLTTQNRGDVYCRVDGSQNLMCHRQPDVDLPLTWLSTAASLAGVAAYFILDLHDNSSRNRLRGYNDALPQSTRPIGRDPLEQMKMQRPSIRDDREEHQGEAQAYCPPPPYETSATPLSSCVLPSIPPRRRDMNKLGLIVVTDVPMDSPFELSAEHEHK